MGRDIQVRDGFGATSPGTSMVPCWHVFIHVYSPGAGADNLLGSEVLHKHKPFVTLVICCKFLPLNDFLTVLPIQKHKRPNLTLP